MKIYLCFISLWLLLAASSVNAVNRCELLFGSAHLSQKGIDSIPAVSLYALPKDFKRALLRQRAIKDLRSIYGTGKNLSIKIYPNVDEFERTGEMRGGDGLAGRGEQMQALFTSKALKTIFPDAKISGFTPKAKTENDIVIWILDSAEHGRREKLLTPKLGNLEMSDIKMANPGAGKLDKVTIREKLGIPLESKVLSLNYSVYNSIEDIQDVVKAAARTKPNVMIVSVAYQSHRLEVLEAHLISSNPKHNIIRMSQLDGSPLPQDKDLIVINDTTGKMHAIYGASDVNVAAGAVNMAEPLLMNTPTIFFDEASKFIHAYDLKIFGRMAEQAKRTGGAQAISNTNQLQEKIETIISGNPNDISAPYLVAIDGDTSPLDRFSSNLKNQLILQSPDTKAMEDILASPLARQGFLNLLNRNLEEVSKALRGSDLEITEEASSKVWSIKIPISSFDKLTSTEVANIKRNAESLRTILLENVKNRVGEWETTAEVLIHFEKKIYPIFQGHRTPTGISNDTAQALRQLLEDPNLGPAYQSIYREALGLPSH